MTLLAFGPVSLRLLDLGVPEGHAAHGHVRQVGGASDRRSRSAGRRKVGRRLGAGSPPGAQVLPVAAAVGGDQVTG